MVAMAGDRHRRGKARGVGDEIGQAALEGRRPHRDFQRAVEGDGGAMAVALDVEPQFLEQGGDVGRRRLLAGVAAGEGQIGFQHRRHLVDVFLDGLDLGAVAEQRELELEPRQHRAQVVRDAGEHGGALLDRALDARFHFQKRGCGAAHFAGAARPKVRRLAALAERFGGVGQPHDRLDLVAQEQDGDGQHDHRGQHHPRQEGQRIGRVGVGARREHAHDGVVKLYADFHDRGTADGVDPERQADLLADLVRQLLIERGEERLWARRRQIGDRQEIDHQAEPVLGDATQLRAIGAGRKSFIDVDEGRDLAGHRRRQIEIDHARLPLDEQEGDDRLQHHERHDDDQERAGIKAVRHHRAQPAGEAVPRPGDVARGAGDRVGGGHHVARRDPQTSHAIVETGHGSKRRD